MTTNFIITIALICGAINSLAIFFLARCVRALHEDIQDVYFNELD